MNLPATKLLIIPALLFLTELAAQDTLIFKPTKKNPLRDTAIVKIILIEEFKFVEYVPYDGFFLNRKDSVRIAHGKPIDKRGARKADYRLVEEIRYDEQLKHIIFFDKNITVKRQNRVEYFKNKNILSGSIAVLGIGSRRPKRGVVFKGVVNEMPAFVLQPSFERLFWKGIAGVKVSPVIVGVNRNYIGTGIGLRAYPLRQLPVSFFIGADFSFVSSTRYRDIEPDKMVDADPYNKDYPIWYSVKERRNELVIPFVAGFSVVRGKHFYASLDGSLGVSRMLSNPKLQFNGDPYKYVSPVLSQLRLTIGRKY